MYKPSFFMVILLFFLQPLLGQPPATERGNVLIQKETTSKTGTTYALITGISTYQANDSYQNLQYADVDARAFYDFIVSPIGAKVKPENVDTLFNENARFMEFWRKFNRIKEKLQKDDVFYIYFSGHGDAYMAEEAYLLAYDAPAGNDRNNYSTGVGLIDIHKLKVRIQQMTSSGVKVIFITDACRTNELPGKNEGQSISYQQIFERKAGEIQLISCASNQVSFEGSQWGGGRGLFSWHLINGLKGMADTEPEDGEVTLTELYDYVKKNVNKASYDAASKKYRQTPQYCCNTADGMVLSMVNPSEKERLIAQLKSGVSYTPDKADYAANKSVHLGTAMKEAGLEELYKLFLKALNEGRLIEKGGAYEILNEILLQKETNAELASELKFTLSSKLLTDVTKVINTYLFAGTNNNNYTYDYFMTAAKKLELFQQLADTLYYNPLDVKVNRLFLEGHANWHTYNTNIMRYSLKKIDSAIALKPQAAYLYNIKGLMQIALKQFVAGEKTLRKGIALAPNWLYPYQNLGSCFSNQGKYDSALVYYKKAMKIDSNYQTTYGAVSVMYYSKGQLDTAILWAKKGIEKDKRDPYLWAQLGYCYNNKKDWKNAFTSFHEARSCNPSLVVVNEGLLRVHLYDYKYPDSVGFYVAEMIRPDSINPMVYQTLGNIFTEFKEYNEAIRMLSISLAIDSLNPDTWKSLGYTYQAMGKDTPAINCFVKAWEIDSTDANTYNMLGNLYFGMGRYKDAQYFYGRAMEYSPENAVLVSNYGQAAEMAGDSIEAETYYRKALQKDPSYAYAHYQLAILYTNQNKKEAAIVELNKAVKLGNYSKEAIEADGYFAPLRNEPGYLALIKKMK
jgi:tetratricopeptide (TPR) repeat protein